MDCQGTNGFPRTGTSQKPHLPPWDLGLWPPVPAGGSFSAPLPPAKADPLASCTHSCLPSARPVGEEPTCVAWQSLGVQTYMHTHRDTHVHIHAHIDSHTETQACTQTDMHTDTRAHTCTCVHTHTQFSPAKSGLSYKFILANPLSNWL